MNGRYFGTLSSREFELRAYEELDSRSKDLMTPVITLRWVERATSFVPALDAVLAAAGNREVIVDFDPNPLDVKSAAEAAEARAHKARRERKELKDLKPGVLAYHARLRDERTQFNAMLSSLTANPVEGGVRWIDLASALPNLRPIVRLTTPEGVLAQVRRANVSDRRVAFRFMAGSEGELDLVRQGIRGLADPSAAVLLVEAGHHRGEVEATVHRVHGALTSLRESLGDGFSGIRKVTVSGSFPGGSLKNHSRLLEAEELRIHRKLSESWDVAYGDHCSIQPRSRQAGGSGFFPHVDLATESHWRVDLVERNRDSSGYVEAAGRIKASAEWSDREECWGVKMIEHASKGRLVHDDITLTLPAPWMAVRINQHMTKRVRS